jgi:hypothetical protein
MQISGMTNITNDEKYKNYLKDAITYYNAALRAEIKKHHPHVDINNINYDDPQFAPIVRDMPFAATAMGSLCSSLGLDERVLTEELWDFVFNGYVPVDVLPADSHLKGYAKETPKGMLVPLSNNPSKFLDNGEWDFDGGRRASTETLFTMGKGLSIWLVAKEIEEPGALKRFQELHHQVLKTAIIPELEKMARLRAREDDELTENHAYEIGMISIMHIDTRPAVPGSDEDKQYNGFAQPHIHFHDQIINSTMGADGKLYTLHNDDIIQNKAHFDGKYMAAMKELLEKEWGIEFEKVMLKRDVNNQFLDDDEKNIASYDISKDVVPEHLIEHYSERIKEIEAEMKKKGVTNTANARQIAQKSTREEKNEMSPSEMIAMWKNEFEELGVSAKTMVNKLKPKLNYVPVQDRQLAINFMRKHKAQQVERALTAMTSNAIHKHAPEETIVNAEEGIVLKKSKLKKESFARKFIGQVYEKKIIESFDRKVGKIEFRLSQFKGHIIKQALDTCTAATAEKEADRIAEEQLQLYLPKERYEYFKPFLDGLVTDHKQLRKMKMEYEREARFITNDTVAQHNYIMHHGAARKDETKWLVPEYIITEEIMKFELEKGFQLSADQVEDVRAAFNQPGAIVSTAGMAGTGKSTSALVKARVWKRMGFDVIGISIATTATKGLAKDAGLEEGKHMNSTQFIKNVESGKLVLKPNSILLFDEAGMGDCHTIFKILKIANEAAGGYENGGGAKVNFMGEKEQLAAIGKASIFKLLNENFVTRPLTTINRQKKAEDVANVKLWQSGQAQKAMEDLFDRGHIRIVKTDQQAYELVSDLYINNEKGVNDKLIMSSLNGDNDQINSKIKSKLQERGEMDSTTRQATIKCEDGVKREFGIGDRVAFYQNTETNNAERTKVDNSDAGYIKNLIKTAEGRVMGLEIEMDKLDTLTGKKQLVFIETMQTPPAIRHHWSATIHKAQGQSKGSAYQLLSKGTAHDASNQYVAASRHKEDYTLIITEEFLNEGIRKNKNKPPLEKQEAKLNWLRDEKKVNVPQYVFETYGNAHKFLKKYEDVQMPGHKTHALDDYSDLIEMFSRQEFKKNVSDFVRIDDGLKMLKDIDKERREDVALFNKNKSELRYIPKPVTKYGRDKDKLANLKATMERAKEKNAQIVVQPVIDVPKKKKPKTLSLT